MLPRIIAVVLLGAFVFAVFRHDETTANTMAPIAFLAAGYVFGDAVVKRNDRGKK